MYSNELLSSRFKQNFTLFLSDVGGVRHADTCNCGMSAPILPTFNQDRAAAQSERSNQPRRAAETRANAELAAALPLPRGARGNRRELPGEAGAAARKARLRRGAHLPLLPGPERTGSLTAARSGEVPSGPASVTGLAGAPSRCACPGPCPTRSPAVPRPPPARPRRPHLAGARWPRRAPSGAKSLPRGGPGAGGAPAPPRLSPIAPPRRALVPGNRFSRRAGVSETVGLSGRDADPCCRHPPRVAGKSQDGPSCSRPRRWASAGRASCPRNTAPRGLGQPRPGRNQSSATCG